VQVDDPAQPFIDLQQPVANRPAVAGADRAAGEETGDKKSLFSGVLKKLVLAQNLHLPFLL
jgi:hypothetical protein